MLYRAAYSFLLKGTRIAIDVQITSKKEITKGKLYVDYYSTYPPRDVSVLLLSSVEEHKIYTNMLRIPAGTGTWKSTYFARHTDITEFN